MVTTELRRNAPRRSSRRMNPPLSSGEPPSKRTRHRSPIVSKVDNLPRIAKTSVVPLMSNGEIANPLTKLVMFAGAPNAISLKWNESALLTEFIEPIARFAGIERPFTPTPPGATRSILLPPAWRSLPLERKALETGYTQTDDEMQVYTKVPQAQGWLDDSRGASFFVASQIDSFSDEYSQQQAPDSFGSTRSVDEVLSQFYEESYAIHEAVPSSQIGPASQAGHASNIGTSFAGTSFESTEFSNDSFDSLAYPSTGVRDIPIAGHLGNLKDIPNANYINSIHPQTMTVNLIIGIISIPEPRTIRTKRGGSVELIEVLVGDETKSGFGINFWTSSVTDFNQNSTSNLLKSLRPQDVVLVKNVALSSFRNKVYGQSLRKDMTKVHLLYRNRIEKGDMRGCYSAADFGPGEKGNAQLEKTRRVREWVFKFVGLGHAAVPGGEEKVRGKSKGRTLAITREVLPDDTQ